MYQRMFQGCTALSTPPVVRLSATNINCCSEMFQGCTSLTSTPVLSCQPVALRSFFHAFQDCSSLLESNWTISSIGTSALLGAFERCPALTSAPTINTWDDANQRWNNIADYSMYCAFRDCSSLTTADFNIGGYVGNTGLAYAFSRSGIISAPIDIM